MRIPDHLLPTRFSPSTRVVTHRVVMVKPGTTPDMVLDPDFWVHGSLQNEGMGGGSVLKVHDDITVIAEDASFRLHLWVVAVDSRGFWVQTRLLGAWPMELMAKHLAKTMVVAETKPVAGPRTWPDNEGYRVEHAGPAHKFRIIDRVGSIVAKGFASEADAIVELDKIKGEKVAA